MEESQIPVKPTTKEENPWVELARFIVIALVIIIPFRIFIAQPFVVSGSSMYPTFENGNYLIIDEISYRFTDPKRGDVIVFKYPADPKKFFIKRVIGLPGETVDIKGVDVTITNNEHPEGFTLLQPYVVNKADNITHFALNENEYFVMGDNRSGSSDSRYWGAVNKKFIIGRAFVRLLPISQVDLFPGDYKQTE